MTGTAGISATEAVRRYSEATGQSHRLLGRLAGGETGAVEIEEGDGTRLVLKWEPNPSGAAKRVTGLEVSERLRCDAGWPVPIQRSVTHDGVLFVAQQFMPGTTVTEFTHAVVDDLLALHERRLDLAVPSTDHRWAEEILVALSTGGDGYCLHEPLRSHDQRTRRIVERIEVIGASTPLEAFSVTTLVHADLHAGNLLQVGGRLSAIVDLDFAAVGDAAFDLVCLAVSSLTTATAGGVRRRLFAAGVDCLDEARRTAYCANVLLRGLDWAIRKNRIDDVEFWIRQSGRLIG